MERRWALQQLPLELHTATYDEPVAVIGDIHGRSDLLDALIAALPAHIPLLFLGDLGDRGGLDTRGVVRRLIDHGARGVRGNHEEWHIAWLRGEPFGSETCHMMGGRVTLASYGYSLARAGGGPHDFPEPHAAFFTALPAALDLRVCGVPYWMAHAGAPAIGGRMGLPLHQIVPMLARHAPEELLWPKQDPARMAPLDRTMIMGHVPQTEVRDHGHVIAVDTGAGRPGGRLSAVVLPERRAVTVG